MKKTLHLFVLHVVKSQLGNKKKTDSIEVGQLLFLILTQRVTGPASVAVREYACVICKKIHFFVFDI